MCCDQFEVWVTECGFPPKGSFSTKQMEILKAKLEDKERKDEEKYEKMTKGEKKKYTPFKADWEAYSDWLNETKTRERHTKEGRASINQPECPVCENQQI